MIDGPRRAFQLAKRLAIAEGKASFQIDRPWQVERTVGVCLFHKMTVLLSLADIAILLGLFLNKELSTGGGCGS